MFISHLLLCTSISKIFLVGSRCDVCADNYFGNPDQPGGSCLPCNCSKNVDVSRPGNCDPRTGQCLSCLFDTEGFNCEICKAGFYGDAVNQRCIGWFSKWIMLFFIWTCFVLIFFSSWVLIKIYFFGSLCLQCAWYKSNSWSLWPYHWAMFLFAKCCWAILWWVQTKPLEDSKWAGLWGLWLWPYRFWWNSV